MVAGLSERALDGSRTENEAVCTFRMGPFMTSVWLSILDDKKFAFRRLTVITFSPEERMIVCSCGISQDRNDTDYYVDALGGYLITILRYQSTQPSQGGTFYGMNVKS